VGEGTYVRSLPANKKANLSGWKRLILSPEIGTLRLRSGQAEWNACPPGQKLGYDYGIMTIV